MTIPLTESHSVKYKHHNYINVLDWMIKEIDITNVPKDDGYPLATIH